MKKLLFILLLFINFAAKAQQTYSINGTVSDGKGVTLPGATVFITNSKYIQATNNEGKFSFNNLTPGTYEVVVKLLGFEPDIQSVTIRERSANLTARLKESITALKGVNISGGRDIYRERYLALFIKNFLGETVNAQQCKLLNPDALSFHYNKNNDFRLTATADDFLVVENKALGYTLKYLLTAFDLDMQNDVCTIGGSPYFEEMKGTEAQQKKWQINRRVAYLSSDRHFFKAVMNNTAKTEGFSVYQVMDNPIMIQNTPENERWTFYQDSDDPSRRKLVNIRILNIDALFMADNQDFKTLISVARPVNRDKPELGGYFVVYTGEDESALYYNTGGNIELPLKSIPRKRQISIIHPLSETVMIDRNGEVTPALGFLYAGYWAWLRIADLTPLDYFGEPVSDKK